MAKESIKTVTGINNDGDWDEVTGTSYAVPGGVKRALDVSLTGGSATYIPSGLRTAGRITEVVINDTTWTALPIASLANRNAISIQNRTGVEIKINYDNTVVGYVGMTVPDQYERHYDITDAIIIYAKAAAGSVSLTIEEIS